jgi:hypothetical protein
VGILPEFETDDTETVVETGNDGDIVLETADDRVRVVDDDAFETDVEEPAIVTDAETGKLDVPEMVTVVGMVNEEEPQDPRRPLISRQRGMLIIVLETGALDRDEVGEIVVSEAKTPPLELVDTVCDEVWDEAPCADKKRGRPKTRIPPDVEGLEVALEVIDNDVAVMDREEMVPAPAVGSEVAGSAVLEVEINDDANKAVDGGTEVSVETDGSGDTETGVEVDTEIGTDPLAGAEGLIDELKGTDLRELSGIEDPDWALIVVRDPTEADVGVEMVNGLLVTANPDPVLTTEESVSEVGIVKGRELALIGVPDGKLVETDPSDVDTDNNDLWFVDEEELDTDCACVLWSKPGIATVGVEVEAPFTPSGGTVTLGVFGTLTTDPELPVEEVGAAGSADDPKAVGLDELSPVGLELKREDDCNDAVVELAGTWEDDNVFVPDNVFDDPCPEVERNVD